MLRCLQAITSQDKPRNIFDQGVKNHFCSYIIHRYMDKIQQLRVLKLVLPIEKSRHMKYINKLLLLPQENPYARSLTLAT